MRWATTTDRAYFMILNDHEVLVNTLLLLPLKQFDNVYFTKTLALAMIREYYKDIRVAWGYHLSGH